MLCFGMILDDYISDHPQVTLASYQPYTSLSNLLLLNWKPSKMWWRINYLVILAIDWVFCYLLIPCIDHDVWHLLVECWHWCTSTLFTTCRKVAGSNISLYPCFLFGFLVLSVFSFVFLSFWFFMFFFLYTMCWSIHAIVSQPHIT